MEYSMSVTQQIESLHKRCRAAKYINFTLGSILIILVAVYSLMPDYKSPPKATHRIIVSVDGEVKLVDAEHIRWSEFLTPLIARDQQTGENIDFAFKYDFKGTDLSKETLSYSLILQLGSLLKHGVLIGLVIAIYLAFTYITTGAVGPTFKLIIGGSFLLMINPVLNTLGFADNLNNSNQASTYVPVEQQHFISSQASWIIGDADVAATELANADIGALTTFPQKTQFLALQREFGLPAPEELLREYREQQQILHDNQRYLKVSLTYAYKILGCILLVTLALYSVIVFNIRMIERNIRKPLDNSNQVRQAVADE